MLKVNLQPGKYIVAVSGGVDSMVLLDLLRRQPDTHLIVAHFDHGIRQDSRADRRLVEAVAAQHGLPFEYAEGNLGPDTSEAAAREARYAFLETVRKRHNARAVVTAHHQDDAIETAILNLLRGTNRRGLSSLRSTEARCRPLLACPKAALKRYAAEQGLAWREDSTNQDETYRRNYIRLSLVPRMTASQRDEFVQLIDTIAAVNQELDGALAELVKNLMYNDGISRYTFIMLDHATSKEVLAAWLRLLGIAEYDAATLERLTIGAKTAAAGSHLDVLRGVMMHIDKHKLALYPLKR